MIFGLPPLFDLVVEGVVSRGLANQERIVIRANSDTFTANIGLMLGYRRPDGTVVPLRDRMYWLGSGTIHAGSVINVYTGAGQQKGFENGNNTATYNLFWGLPYVAFDVPEIEPILFRLGEATVGPISVPSTGIPGPQIALTSS